MRKDSSREWYVNLPLKTKTGIPTAHQMNSSPTRSINIFKTETNQGPVPWLFEVDFGDFYFVNCANNAEAVKAYEILKGMGYSSSDKVKTQLKDSYFVYVYEIRKRYRNTRQE